MKTLKMAIIVLLCFSSNCFADLPVLKQLKKGPTVKEYWEEQRIKREQGTKICPVAPVMRTKSVKMAERKPRETIRRSTAQSFATSKSSLEKLGLNGSSSSIEILADTVINTNTVWDSDVHLNGKVYVENAMLWIMPGVTVWNSADGGIIVRNGGVIKANGNPYNWIRFYTDGPGYHNDYEFAIKIESSALGACEINYCYIVYAAVGIWTKNIRLDNPFQDNLVEWCYDGIVEEGPMLTDILNNQMIDCYDDGIEIFMSDANGIASSATRIVMEHNTIIGSFYYGKGQNCGITIHGVPDSNKAGLVCMADNLIVGSYWYAVNQVDGWMAGADRYCHGYYNNYAIENDGNPYDDIEPQILTKDPFIYGYTQYPFFLKQDCPLIDAGAMDIEMAPYLIAKSTSSERIPDSNIVDIGFHYIYWDYVNAGATILSADFDSSYSVKSNDLLLFADYWLYDYQKNYEVWYWDLDDSGVVDAGDLAVIAEYWLSPLDFGHFAMFAKHWQKSVDYRFQDPRPDLNRDGFVNFKDFTLFANQWQQTCDPVLANIVPSFSGDLNNLSGYVEMSINISDSRTHRVFALIDGKLHNEFGSLEEYPLIGLQTENFTNGQHSVKIVSQDINGNIICSQVNQVIFNNELSMLTGNDGFEPGKDYLFYASGSGTYNVKIEDIVNENIIYDESFLDEINTQVPAAFFVEEYGAYQLKITKNLTQGMGLLVETTASTQDKIDFVIGRKFKKEDFPPNANIKMVISIGSKDLVNAKELCWRAVVKAAVKKQHWPVFLNYDACTWDNLKHCLMLNNVKLWYHVAHGNYKLWFKPERTCVEINGNKLFSYLKKDFGDPNNVPQDYKSMGRYERSPSVAELGYSNSGKMTFVQINACYSARKDDFAYIMGMFSDYNQSWPTGMQIYIGWKNMAFKNDILFYYNGFEEDYWKELTTGSSVKDALEYAYYRQPGGRLDCYKNFWYYGAMYEYKHFRYPE